MHELSGFFYDRIVGIRCLYIYILFNYCQYLYTQRNTT